MTPRTMIAGFAGLTALAGSTAFAHHGWSWAEGDQVQLTGVIREIYVGPPHPVLKVDAEGAQWTVELGNPSQTARSGFTEDSAKAGDTITALGNRSKDQAEKRMKAVRVTVGGKTYDIYPERIQKGS